MLKFRVLAVAAPTALALALLTTVSAAAQQSNAVNMEWFGWSFFRFTSPQGRIVLTNPFAQNPDSPIKATDIPAADIIFAADGHADEMGSIIEIAQNTGA